MSEVYKRPAKLIHLSLSMTYHLLMSSIAAKTERRAFAANNITVIIVRTEMALKFKKTGDAEAVLIQRSASFPR